jgi:nicotinate-nucleotide adenylyltransferase
LTPPSGLFGGAFDPPHNGHLAVARGALEQLRLGRLLVLVSERPGHRAVVSPPAVRLELARAAFGALERTKVELDPYPRTVRLLRGRPDLEEPIVVVGADQLADFPAWEDPEEVLRLARLGVATRPGVDEAAVQRALDAVGQPDRVVRFRIEPVAVSSSEVRARLARGEPVDHLVPPGVAALLARHAGSASARG